MGNAERDVLVKMVQRMLMDKANIGNIADLSGWPLDHAQMIRSVWPEESWRILQPGGVPLDTMDTTRPIAVYPNMIFQVPENYYEERNVLKVFVVGYHATLALELGKVWQLLPDVVPNPRVQIATHVIDDKLDSTLDSAEERDKITTMVTNGQNFELLNKLVGGKLAEGSKGQFGRATEQSGDDFVKEEQENKSKIEEETAKEEE